MRVLITGMPYQIQRAVRLRWTQWASDASRTASGM